MCRMKCITWVEDLSTLKCTSLHIKQVEVFLESTIQVIIIFQTWKCLNKIIHHTKPLEPRTRSSESIVMGAFWLLLMLHNLCLNIRLGILLVEYQVTSSINRQDLHMINHNSKMYLLIMVAMLAIIRSTKTRSLPLLTSHQDTQTQSMESCQPNFSTTTILISSMGISKIVSANIRLRLPFMALRGRAILSHQTT